MTMVAKAPVALIRSRRARKYGTDHFSGAGRQDTARSEADRRGAKDIGEGRRAQRLQQILPAPGTHQQIREHRRQRQRQPLRPRAHDLADHAPQIDVVQEQRDEQHRERQDNDCAEM